MLDELNTDKKIVGLKQTQRFISEGKVGKVFIARDADTRVVNQIISECQSRDIEIEYIESMADLGNACKIEVGAAIAALLK